MGWIDTTIDVRAINADLGRPDLRSVPGNPIPLADPYIQRLTLLA